MENVMQNMDNKTRMCVLGMKRFSLEVWAQYNLI